MVHQVEQTGEKYNRLEICRIDYKIDSVEQTREEENGLKRSRIQTTERRLERREQTIEINKNRLEDKVEKKYNYITRDQREYDTKQNLKTQKGVKIRNYAVNTGYITQNQNVRMDLKENTNLERGKRSNFCKYLKSNFQ